MKFYPRLNKTHFTRRKLSCYYIARRDVKGRRTFTMISMDMRLLVLGSALLLHLYVYIMKTRYCWHTQSFPVRYVNDVHSLRFKHSK